MKKAVVSKEVALVDLESFINKWVKKPVGKDELEEVYPDVLDAIMDGFLSFDESQVPTFKLKDPIKSDSGQISVSEINFKTRIKPTVLADIAEGLNPAKQMFKLQLRMTAHIIGQPVAMIDNFERYDLDVINSVASVFS
jgi:hypothetical protein